MTGVAINLETLELLSQYLSKDLALKLTKILTIKEYQTRQSLKRTIISEFKAVSEPQFTFPGAEKLPANTIALIDEKYDYQHVLDAYVLDEVDFTGIPKEYLK